jgi:hypothetical protein
MSLRGWYLHVPRSVAAPCLALVVCTLEGTDVHILKLMVT